MTHLERMTGSFIPKFCLQERWSGDGRGRAYSWTSLWSYCTQICLGVPPVCSSGIPQGRSGLLIFTGSTGTCREGKKQGERGRRGGRQWGLAPAEWLHCCLPASSFPSSWWQGIPSWICKNLQRPRSCQCVACCSPLPAQQLEVKWSLLWNTCSPSTITPPMIL